MLDYSINYVYEDTMSKFGGRRGRVSFVSLCLMSHNSSSKNGSLLDFANWHSSMLTNLLLDCSS
jgi:hypothetical protein